VPKEVDVLLEQVLGITMTPNLEQGMQSIQSLPHVERIAAYRTHQEFISLLAVLELNRPIDNRVLVEFFQ